MRFAQSRNQVTLEFVNVDSDEAHLWVLQAGVPGVGWVPPAAGGGDYIAAAPPVGNRPSAGQPAETVNFTVLPGSYHYDCPFPGHAAMGMYGPAHRVERVTSGRASRQSHDPGDARSPLTA